MLLLGERRGWKRSFTLRLSSFSNITHHTEGIPEPSVSLGAMGVGGCLDRRVISGARHSGIFGSGFGTCKHSACDLREGGPCTCPHPHYLYVTRHAGRPPPPPGTTPADAGC